MIMKRLGVLTAVCMLLFFVACSDEKEIEAEPAPDLIVEVTPEVTRQPEPEIIIPRHPLNGAILDECIGHIRPWAVLLDNVRTALPQYGISHADIIYEMPVEGGITRVLLLFQDIYGVGEIGPVRSARTYFVEVVQGHDSIFVHAGGSYGAYAALAEWNVSRIDGVAGSGREFFRDQERVRRAGYEHSLMTSDELLLANIDAYDFPMEHSAGFHQGLFFSENGTPDGEQAEEITVRFSNAKTGIFTFDAETELYLVSQYGNPHIDGVTEEQLAVTNVLILLADFRVIDDVGRLGVDFSLGGTGYYASGGQIIPITWSKASYTTPFLFFREDGSPLEMNVGRSYINIVNLNTGEVSFR